jgi:hypothetical protein
MVLVESLPQEKKENVDVKDPTNYNKKISRYGQNERTNWWLDKANKVPLRLHLQF